MRRGTVFVLLCVAVVMTIAGGPALSQEKDYDAPPELRDTGRHLRDLFRQERYADIHAICEAGYAQAANDEARAFFLHKRADAYVAQDNLRGLDLLYQVLYWFPATMQAPLVLLDLADLDLERAEKARDAATRREFAQRAQATLSQFLATYPHHARVPRALWKHGWAYKLLEDWDAMLADYQYAAEVYPNSPWAHVCLEWVVMLLQHDGLHDQAILDARSYLQLYLDKHPDFAQYLIGRSVLAQGDEERALVEFERALALTALDEEKRAKIASMVSSHLLSLGRYQEIHELLQPLLADPNPAFDQWRRCLEQTEAMAYFKARDYPNALVLLRRLHASAQDATDAAVLADTIRQAEQAAAGR